MASEADERTLRAIGLTRTQGLNFYGHFVGLNGDVPADGKATLRIPNDMPGGGPSLGATATLVDMALGSAMRSLMAPGLLLSTVTLALHYRATHGGGLEARAVAQNVEDGHGLVQGTVWDAARGVPLGHAQAWFAAAPPLAGVAPGLMPWEYRSPPPASVPTLDALDERERAILAATRAAAERARRDGTPLPDALLNVTWDGASSGETHGVLAAGPHVENRMGQVQGGVLFAAACLGAQRVLGSSAPTLIDGQYHFLRACTGAAIIQARVLRQGRSVASARVEVRQADVLVGEAQFALRAASRGD